MNAFSDDSDAINSMQWPSSVPAIGAKPTPHSPPGDWSYEQTVADVEAIISSIESGELGLADVLDQFAIAVEHLHHCETFLNQQKQRMDLLIETLTDESTLP